MWHRGLLLVLAAFPWICQTKIQTTSGRGEPIPNSTNTIYLECPNPFIPVGDQCLYFVVYAAENHANSRLVCQSLGGDLAVVDSPTKLKDIISFVNANGMTNYSFWVDGSDTELEGEWRFSSGTFIPMGTPLWFATESFQEPNDASSSLGEDCLILYSSAGHLLNDVNCTRSYPPVCEQSLRRAESLTGQPLVSVSCPPPYVSVGEVCFAFVLWAEGPWLDARQICQSISGELASINDIELLRSIYLYLHEQEIAYHSFWLGGSDRTEEGVWTWLDGQAVPMGQPFWGVGTHYVYEPAGGEAENCLAMNAEGFHYFRDKNCTIPMNPLCTLAQ